MSGIMKSIMPDVDMGEQERLAREKEKRQAQEIKNRRAAIGGKSKTIFSAVEGIGQSTAKKTTLGG